MTQQPPTPQPNNPGPAITRKDIVDVVPLVGEKPAKSPPKSLGHSVGRRRGR